MDEILTDEDKLAKAQNLIAEGEFNQAEEILKTVKLKCGLKYFLLSEVYRSRNWFNEQYKMLKKAIKDEPDNPEYKKAFDELQQFRENPIYKEQLRKKQMGDAAECGFLCCCEACGTALCEGGCDC